MGRDMMAGNRPLYRFAHGVRCHCSNVHNVDAAAGQAGAQSRFPKVGPGERLVLVDLEGPAVITRLWLTFDWPGFKPYERSILRNRLVSMEITWDDAATPAIRVPVGDFFNHPLGYDLPFENAFFASPVGRSLMSFIPMPFRKRARIEIVNAFDRPISVFHDIRLLRGPDPDPDDGYLHACFQRTIPTAPGLEHAILPRIHGRGRYLGTHLGIITDPANPLPWHGANPKFFFDDDDAFPSMMGASLDDFGGASWAAEKPYLHRDSGLLLSRPFSGGGGHFGLYYYHRRDPLIFDRSCAVSIRPLIGLSADRLLEVLREQPEVAARMALPAVTSDELLEHVKTGIDAWFDCGRGDDVSSVAFYYLDRPEGDHALCTPDTRCAPAPHWPETDTSRWLDNQQGIT